MNGEGHTSTSGWHADELKAVGEYYPFGLRGRSADVSRGRGSYMCGGEMRGTGASSTSRSYRVVLVQQ